MQLISLKLHTLALKDLIFKLMFSKYGSLLSHLSHSFQKLALYTLSIILRWTLPVLIIVMPIIISVSLFSFRLAKVILRLNLVLTKGVLNISFFLYRCYIDFVGTKKVFFEFVLL